MKGGVWGILIALTVVAILGLVIFPKTGFVAQSTGGVSLETLKLSARVGCLQNSQCPEGNECMDTQCIDKSEIDKCQTINLDTPTRKIKTGDSINSVKEVLTKADLPYLLSGGEFVKIVDGKAVEYFYTSIILIGNNSLEKEANKYSIQNNEPLYTYILTFSNGVDFSDKDIQGQALRILGKEYAINSDSGNSMIKLSSDKSTITLQKENNTKITKDENGKIIRIEISSSLQNPLKDAEANTDSVFNSAKLSFDPITADSAGIKMGGIC